MVEPTTSPPADALDGKDENHVLSEWVTQKQLAKELGVSMDTLQRWQTARTGPPRAKIGSRVLYRREAVKTWLRTREDKSL